MSIATAEAGRDTVGRDAVRSPGLMLAVATIGFAVNFWAWALLSPLGPLFRTEGTLGALTESDVALLVAVPGHCCVARSGRARDWCHELVLGLRVRWFPVSS